MCFDVGMSVFGIFEKCCKTFVIFYIQFREVKRLMTISLSPVYAHFSETLSGLATIRALRATERFSLDNERKLELNQRANFSGDSIW